MDRVTVRFDHRESHTPVMEVEVAASTTIGALRELLMGRLASEEHCMMRVFTKWHAEVVLAGGKKRLVELTAADEDEPLHSIGISHLSEVHLEGPLTGDSIEGVGQALSLMWGQMQSSSARTNALLLQLTKQIERLETKAANHSDMLGLLMSVANTVNYVALRAIQKDINVLPLEAELADRAIRAEEGQEFARLQLLCGAEAGYHKIWAEATAKIGKIPVPCPPYLIDQTTPHDGFSISADGTTATKISEDEWTTFRASKPLSLANHRWAVRMVKGGANCVGLLPKLSAAKVANMKGTDIEDLGGWCISCNGSALGNGWCEYCKVTFREGDLVTLDFSFAAKTLTISCNGKRFVGRIPFIKDGDELYPAVTMFSLGFQICFERHP